MKLPPFKVQNRGPYNRAQLYYVFVTGLRYLKLACDAESSEVVVSAVVAPGVEGFLEFAMAGISSSESVRSTWW